MQTRIALIASHVIQYQAPFFRLLAAEPSIDLTVLFCSRAGAERYRDSEMQTDLAWDVDLLSGYRHQFLHNFGRGEGYGRAVNPGIVPALLFGNFDAAIFFLGWGTITSALGIAACRARGLPFFLFGDSSYPPAEVTARDHLRARFLRIIFGLAGGFLTSGKLNADYYAHYGANPQRFFLLPWAVDNERFAVESAMGVDERSLIRSEIGASADDIVLVFSAKLLPRKDPLTLLRAVAQMSTQRQAVVLFLGNGPLLDDLRQFAAANDLRVHFAGFVNQSELPRYYAAGDVFVLPSLYEPRGSVVNEAMACGLPVVVSDRCGSIGDIVLEGENAMIYPAGDEVALAAILQRLMVDKHLLKRMGERSREIIATWDYERGVEGVRLALASVIGPHS